ncbi:F-box/kelch-repeat protein At3g06240-like [Rutidosis leptorrhynchoides]|uniref:F-box/kelch-repeat protein At3g06240-like n=1 Tax=Rutidosis leptorrhynchoides TaxID=125765 RepID=UPI003A99EF50
MASGFLPDEIVVNILARLTAKPLVWFRCVSKYWHSMLMDPYFMNLRSRKTIIFPLPDKTLHFIDDDYTTFSSFKPCSPCVNAEVIGSLNGLVLLMNNVNAFILYNPFIGESCELPFPPPPNNDCNINKCRYGYGFAYGASPDDLKVVRISALTHICDVFDFKSKSWSSRIITISNDFRLVYQMGTFVNGFLYWPVQSDSKLIALSVKDMVFTEMTIPDTSFRERLGTINGHICYLEKVSFRQFKLWVKKECNHLDGPWVNPYLFKFDPNLTDNFYSLYQTLNILDDGRIFMVNNSMQLIIFDISSSSYKVLEIPSSDDHLSSIFNMRCVEYVETLISPLDILAGNVKEENNHRR